MAIGGLNGNRGLKLGIDGTNSRSTMSQKIEFLYFDIGGVLLSFDAGVACQQLAEVASISVDRVWDTLFESDLQIQYETGQMTTEEFFDEFSRRTETDANREALVLAGSDIFELIEQSAEIVNQLRSTNCQLGLLSNTCDAHWTFLRNKWDDLFDKAFQTHALSFEIGVMKPDPRIYEAAGRLAGVPFERTFFVDDRPENVEAACAAGMDAVQFTSPQQLALDLRKRGLLAG